MTKKRKTTDHIYITPSLRALRDNALYYSENSVKKTIANQEIFLQSNSSLYTLEEQSDLRKKMETAMYKYKLVSISLEQLHIIRQTMSNEAGLSKSSKEKEFAINDDDLLLIAWSFEGFLFQCRAFLDLYWIYLCTYLKISEPGHMSKTKFFKALKTIRNQKFKEKAIQIEKYFMERVFDPSSQLEDPLSPLNWGTLLREVRDKIAHKGKLEMKFEPQISIYYPFQFNWPTVQKVGYERFCQAMQNGMFFLLVEMTPILYETEWQTGPYVEFP